MERNVEKMKGGGKMDRNDINIISKRIYDMGHLGSGMKMERNIVKRIGKMDKNMNGGIKMARKGTKKITKMTSRMGKKYTGAKMDRKSMKIIIKTGEN